MNAYFFKMTKEEKENILDKHKNIYDGYVTEYGKSNQQPLYVQDFANDKEGITVSNKGDVMTYRNMNINEDVFSGSGGSGMMEPEETFEEDEMYVSLGEKLDTIGDGPTDLPHGTVDFDDTEDDFMVLMSPDMELDEYEDMNDFSEEVFEEETFEDEEKEKIKEKITESLNMFKRMKNYN